MNTKSAEFLESLKAFNDELILFVENCSKHDWKKICSPEDWPVGVTARHIGAAHYQAFSMAEKVLREESLPEMSMEDLIRSANLHAQEHADCTKSEVLQVLRQNGKRVIDMVSSLTDADLEKKGYMPLIGRELTVRQLLKAVILMGGGEHFENMKKAVSQ